MNYFKQSFRRWLGWLALATLFAIACGFLSNWQFARRQQVVAVIRQIDANYSVAPLSLTRVHDVAKQKWMPVRLTGNYRPELALLVRNRSQKGNPGFEQLVPFQTDSKLIFIDRGWIPTGDRQDLPDVNPLPTSISTQLVGHIMPSEPRLNRSAPRGQIATISLYLAAHQLELNPNAVERTYYLTLSQETPQAAKQPIKIDKPELDEGNHLSYAIQWILFAILAFGALVWAVRREYEEYRLATDPNYVARPKRISKSKFDEVAEDGILEKLTKGN